MAAQLAVERGALQPGLGERLQRRPDLGDEVHAVAVEGRLLEVVAPVVRREVSVAIRSASSSTASNVSRGVLGEPGPVVSVSTSSHSYSRKSRSRAGRISEAIPPRYGEWIA